MIRGNVIRILLNEKIKGGGYVPGTERLRSAEGMELKRKKAERGFPKLCLLGEEDVTSS